MRWSELTARASGGISVLLLLGDGALDEVRRLAPAASLTIGRPTLARLEQNGELLDEALVCVHEPERVELHLHGSPPLVRRIGRLLGGGDARVVANGAPARESEAADAIESRRLAWELLPRATCASAARMLLDQAEGALERELERLDALPEARRAAGLRELDARSDRARLLIDPPRLLLAGPVNAGKSTLFNALLGRERAITSGRAGTTRDLLREPALLGEWPVQLVDSAGDRALNASHAVELAGQDLGRHERSRADLTLWLQPPGAEPPPGPAAGETRVVLPSRGDLPGAEPDALRPLEDPVAARERVAALLRDVLGLPERAWKPGAGVRLTRG